jgi:hypothetical protein
MDKLTNSFLNKYTQDGIDAFKFLIEDMTSAGLKIIVLTDNPQYCLEMGIGSADETGKLKSTRVKMVKDYSARYKEWKNESDAPEHFFFDDKTRWEWYRKCWKGAGGLNTNLMVIIFANGMGNMMDLSTGEEPDPDLEIENML